MFIHPMDAVGLLRQVDADSRNLHLTAPLGDWNVWERPIWHIRCLTGQGHSISFVKPLQRRFAARIICLPPPYGASMSSQLEAVEAQALKLSAEERAQLADRLIASL